MRLILFALVAIVLFGGVFAVFYLMFRQRDASLTYEKLGIEANMDYDVSGGYLTYASATDLIQVRPVGWSDRIGLNVIEICQAADIVYMALHGADGENDGRQNQDPI